MDRKELLEEKDFACVFQVDGSETITWDKQTRLRVPCDKCWSLAQCLRMKHTLDPMDIAFLHLDDAPGVTPAKRSCKSVSPATPARRPYKRANPSGCAKASGSEGRGRKQARVCGSTSPAAIRRVSLGLRPPVPASTPNPTSPPRGGAARMNQNHSPSTSTAYSTSSSNGGGGGAGSDRTSPGGTAGCKGKGPARRQPSGASNGSDRRSQSQVGSASGGSDPPSESQPAGPSGGSDPQLQSQASGATGGGDQQSQSQTAGTSGGSEPQSKSQPTGPDGGSEPQSQSQPGGADGGSDPQSQSQPDAAAGAGVGAGGVQFQSANEGNALYVEKLRSEVRLAEERVQKTTKHLSDLDKIKEHARAQIRDAERLLNSSANNEQEVQAKLARLKEEETVAKDQLKNALRVSAEKLMAEAARLEKEARQLLA